MTVNKIDDLTIMFAFDNAKDGLQLDGAPEGRMSEIFVESCQEKLLSRFVHFCFTNFDIEKINHFCLSDDKIDF